MSDPNVHWHAYCKACGGRIRFNDKSHAVVHVNKENAATERIVYNRAAFVKDHKTYLYECVSNPCIDFSPETHVDWCKEVELDA